MRLSKEIIHQSLACIPAVLVQFMIGIGWGWTAPTLHKLQNDHHSEFSITPDEASWLGSIGEAGRMLGPIISPPLVDHLGRKSTLLVVTIVYVVVWSILLISNNIYLVLASRLLFGIGNGVNDVASTVYTSEICSPIFRGISGGAIVVSFFLGHIFESFVSTYLSYTNTAIINTVIAVSAIGSLYFGVETSYFLTMKGKHEKAKENLMWLQPGRTDIDEELAKIRKNVEEEKEKTQSYKSLLMEGNNLKALFAAVIYGMLYSAVGYHTVLPYASFIFSPSAWFTSNEFTIMFSIAQFATSILSCFVIEKIDRRPLFLYSYILLTCWNVCIAVLLYLRRQDYDIPFYPWLIFSCTTLYGVVYTLMLPAAYIAASEILPLSVRAIGGSMSVTFQSAASFATAVLFWPITEHFGMECNFMIYVVTSAITVIFVYKILPETRGKALHDMYKNPDETE